MDKKYFWKEVVPKSTREQIIGGGTTAYLSAFITLVAAFFINPLMLIDSIVVLLLGLGIHLGKSRTCAIIITVYFIWSKLQQVTSGFGSFNVTALLFIFFFAMSIVGTFKYHKLKKEFITDPSISK